MRVRRGSFVSQDRIVNNKVPHAGIALHDTGLYIMVLYRYTQSMIHVPVIIRNSCTVHVGVLLVCYEYILYKYSYHAPWYSYVGLGPVHVRGIRVIMLAFQVYESDLCWYQICMCPQCTCTIVHSCIGYTPLA